MVYTAKNRILKNNTFRRRIHGGDPDDKSNANGLDESTASSSTPNSTIDTTATSSAPSSTASSSTASSSTAPSYAPVSGPDLNPLKNSNVHMKSLSEDTDLLNRIKTQHPNNDFTNSVVINLPQDVPVVFKYGDTVFIMNLAVSTQSSVPETTPTINPTNEKSNEDVVAEKILNNLNDLIKTSASTENIPPPTSEQISNA
jgi:hypothetical protein